MQFADAKEMLVRLQQIENAQDLGTDAIRQLQIRIPAGPSQIHHQIPFCLGLGCGFEGVARMHQQNFHESFNVRSHSEQQINSLLDG